MGRPHDDRRVVLDRQQTDGLVPRCLPVEELGKHTLAPGVLIGNEAECPTAVEDAAGVCAGPLFVQQCNAAGRARGHQVFVDQRVIQRAHHRDEWESQARDRVAGELVIAEMGGDHDHAPFGEQLA